MTQNMANIRLTVLIIAQCNLVSTLSEYNIIVVYNTPNTMRNYLCSTGESVAPLINVCTL